MAIHLLISARRFHYNILYDYKYNRFIYVLQTRILLSELPCVSVRVCVQSDHQTCRDFRLKFSNVFLNLSRYINSITFCFKIINIIYIISFHFKRYFLNVHYLFCPWSLLNVSNYRNSIFIWLYVNYKPNSY